VTEYDVHVKGGTIVDGTGAPRYRGDLWIKDGKIVKTGGKADGQSERIIDAAGCIVAPGAIDLHTHYDAQVHWDPYCTLSGWHGVTTVVMGNCGFGFAPCKPEFRERSMRTLVRTEAIDWEAMVEGFAPRWETFGWETIPQYLDALDQTPLGVNAVHFMPTASLMTYVMGLEAAKTRPATAAERKEMQRLLHEGMDAGLCGFSIQRLGENSVQTDFDGTPMVTDLMSDDDILALAEVLRERDEGFVQITQDTSGNMQLDPHDRAFVKRLAEVARRPVLDNFVFPNPQDRDFHRPRIDWIADCQAQGIPVYGQAATTRTGFTFSLENWNLYDSSPAWKELTTGTFEEKMQKFQDRELRERVKAETDETGTMFDAMKAQVGGEPKFLMVAYVKDQPDLTERYAGKTLAVLAQEQGKHPVDVMLDISHESGLQTFFQSGNPGAFNARNTAALYLDSPYTVPGVSDGGAHAKFFTGGNWPTDILAWLVRDSGEMSLEQAHYRSAGLPAHIGSLKNRGVLREGYQADILVYDLDHLEIYPAWVGEVTYDLPGGGWRRVQKAKGYRHILVNGVETFTDGISTGATPGRLLRHGRG
jgi:N-acyl-D-aspartate/D-glutamate deacylase